MRKLMFLFFGWFISCSPYTPISIEDYPVVTGTGKTYYVDSINGNDENSGESEIQAWKTVGKVNNTALGAGAVVRFKRGGVWRERIKPQSGNKNGWIMYTDYGTGELPLFLGSVEGDTNTLWTSSGGNLWKFTRILDDDIGNILVSQTNALYKKWNLSDLQSQGHFYYDKTDKSLTVYSIQNPADYYDGMELCTGQHMVYTDHPEWEYIGVMDVSNVIFDHLAVKYAGGYAFKFQNCHHIQVLNCEISYCGGAEVQGQPQVRYGNGIEFYDYAFYCKAISNTIYEIYDSGVSVQAVEGSPISCGVEFLNNTIYNCAYASYELWFIWKTENTEAVLSNIVFANNVCSNAGGGWGVQRPEDNGYHILMDATLAETSGLVITNNRYENAKCGFFMMCTSFNNWRSFRIANNTYVSPTNARAYTAYGWHDHSIVYDYDFTHLADYQSATGFGEGSIFNY